MNSPSTDPAKVSIERLFNEPFEPAWMKQANQDELLEIAKLWKIIKERSELQWLVEAERSHQRIMQNCKGVWRIC